MTVTQAEDQRVLDRAIERVTTGEFTTLYRQLDSLKALRKKHANDYIGAQSAAILAETYDQVGKYKEAREFANYSEGVQQLRKLEDEVGRLQPMREAVRAHAWLILQCAVNEFRRQGGAKDALDLLNRAINLITPNKGEAIASQHIQSLFHFWRGRILSTAAYLFRDADEEFEAALKVADATVESKLIRTAKLGVDDKRKGELRSMYLEGGMYVLSTILGFGLAHARQLESQLKESLWFLRAAIPLSRVNGDVHRRGFAHLLMGTAMRGTAHGDGEELDAADRELEIARRLLSEQEPHTLHLARVHHQLALSHYNRVPPGVASTETAKSHLRKALQYNQDAEALSNQYDQVFRDPLLTYGIKVAFSLIETAQGNFKRGYDHANEALGTIAHNLPKETRGWAALAKGIACSEQTTKLGHSAEEAESLLLEVVDDKYLRRTDCAAALLHLSRLCSRVGQPFKAAKYYSRAVVLAEASEHGWLHDLQKNTQDLMKADAGPDLFINIPDALVDARIKGEKPLESINKFLDLQVKRRVLALDEIQAMLKENKGEEKVATALGLTRATVFNWKRDPKLRDYFRSVERRKK